MALHRLTALAVVGALALGVSSCGDDSPSPAPSTSSAAASPTPTATGPAAPVLPDLATRHDAVGAKAFVKYWFDAANFAIATGDVAPVHAVSTDDCGSCRSLIGSVKRVYAAGGRIEGGRLEVDRLEHDGRVPAPTFRFALRLRQQPKREIAKTGTVAHEEDGATALFYVAARWSDGFEFIGMERVDD